ncbi:acetate kinase [Xiashengella succiniciproducens]|jgi:acetate kinase|uniref:Acetate kinase n=1 Tax=Xiashengella succiniciproducens TaxID=2949635 RepID=A0A9J6ZSX8_9BACT|nr:acetate kinase [Alkaliflexus sp. Ai-910]MDI9537958.1 acetate kinase [Bacteroidota bacterium]URW80694.1 acetate kinase [Alkaliflexus sp. Ai-910]HHU01436.1 acetate kinase [Bacteroidales bacterium]
MKILVMNCGSSSIKYQLFNMDSNNWSVMAKGGVEKVGLKGSFLKHEKENGEKVLLEGEIMDHATGIDYILGVMTSERHGCIKSLEEIDAVGHRVVHGGETFNSSVFITDEVITKMKDCIELAPLHNPPNLKGIFAISSLLPHVPQVGVFDTAFHQTMPKHAYMYAIPNSLYKKYGVRRYGFHGTSHRYVSKRAAEILNEDYANLRIISCHLGNGASIAAIMGGKSIDTSMGFTPLEGLMMGTRSGDLDVGAVTYIMEKEMIGTKSASVLFNKHSGMLGVTGISSDMREIESAIEKGDELAKIGMEMYTYRVKKYIGSYAAAMGGVDVVIFTGGVGENGDDTRASICQGLEFIGVEVDPAKNKKLRSKEAVISKDGAKVKVMVVPTNEELVIAQDTMQIVEELVRK